MNKIDEIPLNFIYMFLHSMRYFPTKVPSKIKEIYKKKKKKLENVESLCLIKYIIRF